MVRFDPTRADLAPYGFSCQRWSPTVMRRPDRHNEIEVNLLTEGWLTYLLGGETVRIEANRIAIFWAAVPHQIIAHGGQPAYYVLTIPLGWFLRLRLPDRFVQPLLHGRLISAPLNAAHAEDELIRFEDWERDLTLGESDANKATFLEIEARLHRLSLADHDGGEPAPVPIKRHLAVQDGGLAKAEQMAHLVAKRYPEPIRTSDFARDLNLQPKHALKLFQSAFGMSLPDYITQYRIAQVQRLLVTTDLSILDIAQATGFGSLSRFNSVFRQRCGCPPRRYRLTHALSDVLPARPGWIGGAVPRPRARGE